ncbi:MAG: nickel pincer cofactor biosynthesis protein LarC [Planctomycetes bacterium]|nr:nickel pincer cofactor biosynthesis protein LarC [Planctomycetota bacterium]
MRIAYLDCFSGIAGDMCVAALLDAGLPLDELRSTLDSLPVRGFEISTEAVRRSSIHGLRFHVRLTAPDHGHRGLGEIRAILRGSRLPEPALVSALAVFERLALSEARAHAIPVEAVHFHEVGAIDCIVDIAAACWGFHRLGVERILASPPPTGSGFVRCAHGAMPIPTPGALGALVGSEVVFGGPPLELTTPTGAALLGALAEITTEELALRVEGYGHGAGARELPDRPNLLRVVLGTMDAGRERDEVVELATNLDQLSPELLGHVLERAMSAGALDAWVVPATMKKGRPGAVLHVLADLDRRLALEELLFRETRTLGIRRQRLRRSKLARRELHVHLGPDAVGVKCRRLPDGTWRAQPEFDDVKRIAERTGAPLWDVWEAAQHAAQALAGNGAEAPSASALETQVRSQPEANHGHPQGHGHGHVPGHHHGHDPHDGHDHHHVHDHGHDHGHIHLHRPGSARDPHGDQEARPKP